MQWKYQQQPISEISELPNYKDIYGFIYKIIYDNGLFYIGKKNFYKYIDKEIRFGSKFRDNVVGEPFKKRKGGKLLLYEKVKQETDWKNYQGSHRDRNLYILQEKVILEIAYSKLMLTFLENKYLYNNLLDPNCINEQISNKIFKRQLI